MLDDKIKIQVMTGVAHLVPPEYFVRDVSSIPAMTLMGMKAAGIVSVKQDDTLPVGVIECRSSGDVISRL